MMMHTLRLAAQAFRVRQWPLKAALLMTLVCGTAVHAANDNNAAAARPAEPQSVSAGSSESAETARLRNLYLSQMKTSLLDLHYEVDPVAREKREGGLDWPGRAMTMIGQKRLDNLQMLVADVIENDVPGDLIEAGAWRGGATIFMRAMLEAYGDKDRTVWVADSFEGLPPPNPKDFPADKNWHFEQYEELAVSLETVQRNFSVFGLLDDQVKFLKGWFKDTLPGAPIKQLAILRLDGDLYESTIQSLEALYSKLSPGGYVIVDDYCLPPSAKATEDFRKANKIAGSVIKIDLCGVYWQKPKN